MDDGTTLWRCDIHVAVGTLLNPQAGWGMSNKLVLTHFAPVGHHLVVVCLLTAWGSMSWQHSTSQCSIRGKVLPAEAQRRSGCHLSCPLPRPIHHQSSCLQTRLLTVSCSCRQRWDLPILCWQGEGEAVCVVPALWEPGLFGRAELLCCDVLMALRWCAQGCAGWDGSSALLPTEGCRMPGPCLSMGHLLSWLVAWGKGGGLCFCVLSPHFLVTWNRQ